MYIVWSVWTVSQQLCCHRVEVYPMQHSEFDGCNCVADVLQFLYHVWIWFVHCTFQVPQRKLKSTVYKSNPHTIWYRNRRTTSATQLQPSKSLCYIGYTSAWLDIRSCVLMQEATTFNIFCDGISFQHLATILISVFTLCYGPRLLFHGPSCISSAELWPVILLCVLKKYWYQPPGNG